MGRAESNAYALTRDLMLVLSLLHALITNSEAHTRWIQTSGNGSICLNGESSRWTNASHGVYRGQYFLWQIPPNPKAVLFLAQASNQEPWVFFDPSPGCAEICSGMPEPRTIVLDALERGYAVIAIKSLEDEWGLFPVGASADVVIVVSLILDFVREHSMEGLPVFAWGHSWGSDFVTSLSMNPTLQFRGVVPMNGPSQLPLPAIAEINFDRLPPFFFAYMPKTKYYAGIQQTLAFLVQHGVRLEEKQLLPKRVSPLFFTERIRCMSDELSVKIYEALKVEGSLDKHDYVTEDRHDWERVLWDFEVLPLPKELEKTILCLAGAVNEELRKAYAQHSWTSDANDEIFAFLESLGPTVLKLPVSQQYQSEGHFAIHPE